MTVTIWIHQENKYTKKMQSKATENKKLDSFYYDHSHTSGCMNVNFHHTLHFQVSNSLSLNRISIMFKITVLKRACVRTKSVNIISVEQYHSQLTTKIMSYYKQIIGDVNNAQ